MKVTNDEIRRELSEFILHKFLSGESPSLLTDDTPLLSQGILDSISVLHLVAFLEKRFGIELRGQDLTPRHLGSIASIAELVRSKLGRE